VTGYYLVGVILQNTLHLPIPANVIGLILFTVSLFLKLVKLEWVEDAGQFLINHMLLFFTPFVVGTMVFFQFIGENAVQLLFSLFASTIGVLVITGWSAKLFKGKESRQRGSS
jgi:holin-like protein